MAKFIFPYETKLHLIKTALSVADFRNDIKWAERNADGRWIKFMAEMRVTAQELVDHDVTPKSASAMVLYVGEKKTAASNKKQADNGLVANLNIAPCYFCNMPNHTVTTCGHIEKARFQFGYPSPKSKLPAVVPAKVATTGKPYRNTAKKAVAADEPSFSII